MFNGKAAKYPILRLKAGDSKRDFLSGKGGSAATGLVASVSGEISPQDVLNEPIQGACGAGSRGDGRVTFEVSERKFLSVWIKNLSHMRFGHMEERMDAVPDLRTAAMMLAIERIARYYTEYALL